MHVSFTSRRAGQCVTLATEHLVEDQSPLAVEELEQALEALAEIETGLAELAELKFFGGMTNVEITACLGQSESTIKRNWRAL